MKTTYHYPDRNPEYTCILKNPPQPIVLKSESVPQDRMVEFFSVDRKTGVETIYATYPASLFGR